MSAPPKLTAEEREAILLREGPTALFVRLLAESASRKPDGWEHAAKMFAYVARETPERVDLGEAFRLERVLFASDVRNVSPSAHDGARFLPFDLPGCEFAEPQRVTHLLISAKRGDTIRGGAFGYVPLKP